MLEREEEEYYEAGGVYDNGYSARQRERVMVVDVEEEDEGEVAEEISLTTEQILGGDWRVVC